MVTTSFSSKSELALNLSTDGTAITFMGYVAPTNTVDVSNSNTPGAYDATNPAGGSRSQRRDPGTPTNSYNGNNGRAAILANGIYYMVGNANNGSGTPANIIDRAGAQLALPGQSAATPPIQIERPDPGEGCGRVQRERAACVRGCGRKPGANRHSIAGRGGRRTPP